MKYIDADKLKAEIERLGRNWDGVKELQPASLFQADLRELLSIINTLQQEQPEVDWEAFRREAAKDIFCAMIHHQNSTEPIEVSIAIDIADELIKQLKEERNERSVAYER